MLNRRSFLGLTGALGATVLGTKVNGFAEIEQATSGIAHLTPEEVAADEFFWRDIQLAFTLDRTMINLNNGNSCPSPAVVHEAYKRYLDFSNQNPYYHRSLIERNHETTRRRLAAEFGCDPEEMAVTRNSSEALQIAQCGIDLEPGDEVVTTEQDYGRMLTTWDQRVRRDGITLTRINFPVPTTQDDLYTRLEQAITPRTKVLHFCHITNLTGQLFPVKRLSQMARARGIRTIVDGAHAFAHFPYKLADLDCDYYGVSLHKWLLAPTGTGFLYVRKELIPTTWPLQAAPARQDDDIRKFEAIGTHPAGARAAINEALAFHQAIGAERKAARLHYLTTRWGNRLKGHPNLVLNSDLSKGQTWGLANVGITGVDTRKLVAFMWDKYRIVINAIVRDEYQGLRVTPNVYTSLESIDTFSTAMEEVLEKGLPA
jgi:selenocysteine lyase/cysteine desulfurase